jgi:PqqD family protein of HPr-rel-A system
MQSNERLKNLALSDTGFLFDPTTGNTYTLNETGILVLNELKSGKSKSEIVQLLVRDYEVEEDEATRDITDLLIQLQELGLYHE